MIEAQHLTKRYGPVLAVDDLTFRTVRSTFWTLTFTVVALLGLGALFTALEAARWDRRTPVEVPSSIP